MPDITAIFGTHDEKTIDQLRDVASRAEHAALMADGHVGYVMPIGGVAAYRNKVSVVGVGFDIACGNAAIRTDLNVAQFDRAGWEQIANEVASTVSFGVGRRNEADDAPVDHPLFDSDAWGLLDPEVRRGLMVKARQQLGTVGSGNHYVDVFSDEHGAVWVGVHFGSRGLGHTIASGFLALSQNKKWGERAPEREALLDIDTPLGHDYWQLMNLAGEYAYAGREWVARKVVSLLGGRELELVHNHHNFAWKEKHFGEELIVVRKGATPAFPGQKGFVGGSMGDDSVVLQGTDAPDGTAEKALYSTVHGAGRVMSRTEARGKTKGWGPKKRIVAPGKVSWDMVAQWLGPRGVILRGGGLDEAPQAYRRLPEVLEAQGDTIRVVHTLRPIIVAMAGENEFDPYKD
jgi:tRNA-splicing ligase RtcB (3'-phosphate/5'-hydroxy nucleic acid ligase)